MTSEMTRYHMLGQVCTVCGVRKPKAKGFARVRRTGEDMLYRSVCKTCDAVIKAGQPVESEMRLNGDYGKPCVCCGIKKPLREGYRRIRNPERLAKPEYVFHNTCKVCEARKPTPSQACAKCGVDKPLTAYSTDLNRGNGRCVTCRECCAGDKYGVSKHTDYKTDYRPWEIFYYPAARANV